jgi:hypothetical protein
VSPPRREEAFFRAQLALERVLDAAERQPIGFDGVDERLERRRLRVVIAAADEDAVAAASTAKTDDSGTVYSAATAFISRSSLRMTPSNFSSSRSRS